MRASTPVPISCESARPLVLWGSLSLECHLGPGWLPEPSPCPHSSNEEREGTKQWSPFSFMDTCQESHMKPLLPLLGHHLIYKAHLGAWAVRNVVFIPGSTVPCCILEIVLKALRKKEEGILEKTCRLSHKETSSKFLETVSSWKLWTRNTVFL